MLTTELIWLSLLGVGSKSDNKCAPLISPSALKCARFLMQDFRFYYAPHLKRDLCEMNNNSTASYRLHTRRIIKLLHDYFTNTCFFQQTLYVTHKVMFEKRSFKTLKTQDKSRKDIFEIIVENQTVLYSVFVSDLCETDSSC